MRAKKGRKPCKHLIDASGAHGGSEGLNTKIHLAVDANGMPIRIIITEGPTADCAQAPELIENIEADYLLANRGYETDAIVAQAISQEESVIDPESIAKHNAVTINISTNYGTW